MKIVMERSQMMYSSCARGAERMKQLYDAGAEIRMRNAGKGFSIMHCKALILDDHVALSGSVNLTENGMKNNDENFLVVRQEASLTEITNHFWKLWNSPTTEEVTEKVMKEVLWKDAVRQEKSKEASSSRVNPTRSYSAESVGYAKPKSKNAKGVKKYEDHGEQPQEW